jgi:hypothetical protein
MYHQQLRLLRRRMEPNYDGESSSVAFSSASRMPFKRVEEQNAQHGYGTLANACDVC